MGRRETSETKRQSTTEGGMGAAFAGVERGSEREKGEQGGVNRSAVGLRWRGSRKGESSGHARGEDR
jgi:hypothetical protein